MKKCCRKKSFFLSHVLAVLGVMTQVSSIQLLPKFLKAAPGMWQLINLHILNVHVQSTEFYELGVLPYSVVCKDHFGL